MSTTLAAGQCTNVAEFLRLLHPPGSVFEIRAIKCPKKPGSDYKGTARGYFSDIELATKAIAQIEQSQPPGIYLTINACDLQLLARCCNRIQWKSGEDDATGDAHIIRRTMLFVDIDPSRLSGISSTDSQMEDALALGRMIRTDLVAEGWPRPLFGMSGNGAYLLYCIDLPNDEQSKELVKGVLKGLAERFDQGESLGIDTSTFNAGRIAKILGTMSRKGDDLRGVPGFEDRPHRRSWFERPEAPLGTVPESLLRAVAILEQPKPAPPPSNNQQAMANGSAVESCRKYLSKLPPAIEGSKGSNPMFQAACECWRFGLSDSDAWTVLSEWNASHAQPLFNDKERRHKLDSALAEVNKKGEFGKRLRDHQPNELSGRSGTDSRTVSGKPDNEQPISYRLYTCDELDSAEFSLDFLVENVLVAKQPCILAGSKKSLKTSLLVDLGVSLATGGCFLGRFRVPTQNRVLLMSGESGIGTLQETARRIALASGRTLASIGDSLQFSDQLPVVGDRRHHDALKQLILDKRIKVFGLDPAFLSMATSGSEASVFAMGELLHSLNELLQSLGVTLILCHHTKRGVVSPFAAPELEDIAWAGFQEYARQWLLMGRRERFEPGSGMHRLWLNIGGSAGHSALWALDINEGPFVDLKTPRLWEVEISRADEARQRAEKRDEAIKDQQKRKRDDAKLERTVSRLLDAFVRYPAGETKKTLFVGMNVRDGEAALDSLLRQDKVEPCDVRKGNHRTPREGFRLKSDQ
jgi:hypothetical protein